MGNAKQTQAVKPAHNPVKQYQYTWCFRVFVLLLLIFATEKAKGQERAREVKLKAGSQILLNDSIFFISKDTVVLVTTEDELAIKDKGEVDFYLRIKKLREKNRLTNEIVNLVIRPPKPEDDSAKDLSENLARFLPYSGMTIRNIRIKNTDIIGQTVFDTISSDSSFLGRLINETHVYTHERTLKKNLFVKPGDTINPWLLADNERHIRSLSFIENALIHFIPVDDQSIDLVYVVKDKIPYGLLPVYHSSNKQSLKIWNANLLGYGRRTGISFSLDQKNKPTFYLSGVELGANNIYKTFIDSKLQYTRSGNQHRGSISINRDFIPGLVHFAYGLEGSFESKKLADYYTPSEPIASLYTVSTVNSWAGYQFAIGNQNSFTKRPVYFTPAIGWRLNHFYNRPFVSADSNRLFSQNTAFFASFSLNSENFLQTSRLFVQGQQVDLPYGYSISWINGYTFNEFGRMPYFGIDLRLAKSIGRVGYFISQAAFGTHVIENKAKQGSAKFFIGYLSPVFDLITTPSRLYISAGHEQGINRFTNDSIYLRNSENVPGLRSNQLRGFVKSTAMIQIIFYTSKAWLGFNVSPYVFVNSGIIANSMADLGRQRSINGIGAGLRLRNEYLVFSSIQLRLVYYPYTPSGVRGLSFDLDETDNLSDFRFSHWVPDYVGFK